MLDSRGFAGVESHLPTLAAALHGRNMPVLVVFLKDQGLHCVAAFAVGGLPVPQTRPQTAESNAADRGQPREMQDGYRRIAEARDAPGAAAPGVPIHIDEYLGAWLRQ